MASKSMIGIFDSGHGGLTVLQALHQRFPGERLMYLGDHANAPYGNRPSEEVVALTRVAVETLFEKGCRLVMLGCNTATCVAARTLQRDWLPATRYAGTHNVIGIVAPTVEAATQTPWGLTTPQYPQKYNTDLVAVFGTTRTITSFVYPEEIRKRCPKVVVVQQICAELAGAIEDGASRETLDRLVKAGVDGLLAQTGGNPPHRAILGCTHYPLVEDLFRRHLPPFTRLLSQPEVVADSLEDYLARHPHYRDSGGGIGADTAGTGGSGRDDADESSGARSGGVILLTSGDPIDVSKIARIFWPAAPAFTALHDLGPSP